MASGKKAPTAPEFLAIPGNPDGVEVSPIDGMVYVNTVGPVAAAPDPANGGIYAISNSLHFVVETYYQVDYGYQKLV